jgi:hypothetical protein
MRVQALLLLTWLTGCDDPPGVEQPAADVCAGEVAPHGLRRMSATQFARSAAALTGEPFVAEFPIEAGGWEGLAEAQPVVPAVVEAWADAATRIADRVVEQGERRWRVEAEGLGWPQGSTFEVPAAGTDVWWQVGMQQSGVDVAVPVTVPQAGRYEVSVRALWSVGWTHTQEAPTLSVGRDGAFTAPVFVSWTGETPGEARFTLDLPAGDSALTLRLASTSTLFIAVAVDAVSVEGPLDAPFSADGPVRRRWVTCDPRAEGEAACAAEVLRRFARRAWRRSPDEAERARLDELVAGVLADDGGFDLALHTAIRAVLLSPSFVYRWEDVSGLGAGEVRAATPVELATRLSFALWASIPDEELLACAETGELGEDGGCGLSAQVDRMLAADGADALVWDFGRQWLGLDALAEADRDPTLFPMYDADLAAALAEETYSFLDDVRVRRLDPLALVNADWSFPPPDVAALYGVAASDGQPVTLPPERRGLLGHASVLVLTSHADRSSPVQRGKYVLDRLLCEPPEPAPPGIPALSEGAVEGDVADLLAAHRESPACASCHDAIDPLGLAMEDFDAIGRHREVYPNGEPVHPDGALPDGAAVRGTAALAEGLAASPQVRRCLSRSVATWLWERPPGPADEAVLASADAAGDLDALRAALLSGPALRCVAGEAP